MIRSIDLDGLEKYVIHQRSFAPWQFFGEIATGGKYAYSGDNRGYSLANDNQIKSKVSVNVTVDISTAKASLTFSGQTGGGTERYDAKSYELLKVATPVTPEVSMWKPQVQGSTSTYKQRIEGTAPLAPFPILDFASSFVDQPIVWTGSTTIDNHIKDGYINITYQYTGKGFPALESFIEDSKGVKLFMGNYVSPAKTNIVHALSGSESAYSASKTMKVQTDANGDFLVVFVKGRNGEETVINPAVWNQKVLDTQPAKDLPQQQLNVEQLRLNNTVQETWNGVIQF